jgi:indole-3-glycerol phosphate synthase
MRRPGLQEILWRKKTDLDRRKAQVPLRILEKGPWPAPRDFKKALLTGRSVALIAELKRASPSAGMLRAPYDPAYGAREYERGGARALSVLTEENFFGGSLNDLAAAKSACTLPVLRKDFLFDPYQIVESRSWGADAVLLIAAVLRDWELRGLLRMARRLGLTPLVEVHDAAEMQRAAAAGADVIGINSRNLKDLTVDTGLFRKLIPRVPRGAVVVAESGIQGPREMKALKRMRCHAALVGESLLRRRDLAAAVRYLVKGGL